MKSLLCLSITFALFSTFKMYIDINITALWTEGFYNNVYYQCLLLLLPVLTFHSLICFVNNQLMIDIEHRLIHLIRIHSNSWILLITNITQYIMWT